MKRFAAHYLFLPEVGFLKQQVVEVSPEGIVLNFFPLTEEIESVEWLPGVIVLLSELDTKIQKNNGMIVEIIPLFEKNIEKHFKNHWIVSDRSSQCFSEAFDMYRKREISLFPFLLYPFDFSGMQPVVETQHKLLR